MKKLYYYKGFGVKNAFFSKTAIKNNIDNTTEDKEIISNIKYTLEMFKSVIKAIKKKCKWVKDNHIVINSFYRCEILNKLIGGSSNSDHKLGKAIDFIVIGLTPKQICEAIREYYLVFDQLIQEPSWVHISFESVDYLNKKSFLIKTEQGYKKG